MKKYRKRRAQRAARSSVAIATMLMSSCGASGRTILSTGATAPTTTEASSAPLGSNTTTSVGSVTLPSFKTPSKPSVPSIERQLGAVVRGLFATRDAAAAGPTPNPDSPLLAVYAAGDALDQLRAAVREKSDQGLARRRSAEHLSTVRLTDVIADAVSATATFCQIDDDVLYVISTGETVDDTIITRFGTIDFAQTDGAWKVVEAETTQIWDGVAHCAGHLADYPG